jgi:hypothetical protein
LGKELLGSLLQSRDTDSVLAALLRRRAEVEAWLDGPVKKATLTSIDRMIAELEDDAPSGAAERAPARHPRRAAG